MTGVSTRSLLILLVLDAKTSVADLALLHKRQKHTLSLGQGDEGLLAITDNENVAQTGGEGVAAGVLDVGDLVGTGVVLDVLEDTNTTDVVSAGNEDGGAVVELDDAVNGVGLQVDLDGVVLLDVGVGVADGAAVVGHHVGDLVFAEDLALDAAELVLSLLGVNADGHEAALHVVEDAEVLRGLGQRDDVHEAEGVLGVAAHLSVNKHVLGLAVAADLVALLLGERVLQALAEEDAHGDALTELVGTSGGAGGVASGELVELPVGGGEHALQVLLGASCLSKYSALAITPSKESARMGSFNNAISLTIWR